MGRPTGCDIRPVIYGIINTSVTERANYIEIQ